MDGWKVKILEPWPHVRSTDAYLSSSSVSDYCSYSCAKSTTNRSSPYIHTYMVHFPFPIRFPYLFSFSPRDLLPCYTPLYRPCFIQTIPCKKKSWFIFSWGGFFSDSLAHGRGSPWGTVRNRTGLDALEDFGLTMVKLYLATWRD